MPGRHSSPEDGEVDYIDISRNDDDLMEVDDDRVREESSLFLPNSATPPIAPPNVIDLTNGEDEPEPPRERSETSLFVNDEPIEGSPVDNGSNGDGNDDGNNGIDDDDQDGANSDNDDHDMNDGNDDNGINGNADDADADEDDDDNDNSDHDMNDGDDGDDGDDGGGGGGDNNGNDENGDDDEDEDNSNDDEEEEDDSGGGGVPSNQKSPNAALEVALEEDGIAEPEWAEQCLTTCRPHWDEVASAYLRYRKRFLLKRVELREVRARNRQRVHRLQESIEQLRQARGGGGQRRPHKKAS